MVFVGWVFIKEIFVGILFVELIVVEMVVEVVFIENIFIEMVFGLLVSPQRKLSYIWQWLRQASQNSIWPSVLLDCS